MLIVAKILKGKIPPPPPVGIGYVHRIEFPTGVTKPPKPQRAQNFPDAEVFALLKAGKDSIQDIMDATGRKRDPVALKLQRMRKRGQIRVKSKRQNGQPQRFEVAQ